jgi:H+/Na+-translocating ferredoxin:NAD+ oxidoreductase subunit D
MSGPGILITASPHLGARDSTPKIMWQVVLSLVPVLAAACYFFGVSAILVTVGATAGALVTEAAFAKPHTLLDGSAAITGILLALTLPPGLPMWMAFVGGVFAIGFGKLIFGGLGQNIFNPALLGRAFLQAAFPVALTTWPVPRGSFWQLKGDNLALPFMSPRHVDVLTGATPLGAMKFDHAGTQMWKLVLGATGGSLGETSALIILLCGAYLALRNYLNWRTPASIFITVWVFAEALHLLSPAKYPDGLFMLFSGGLMLGAVFMATDLVTSPVTHLGCWIFGLGVGVLVVVIRIWGGLAEGVMYSILLMNAFVPFINRATQPRVFGHARKPEAA